ncbi:MAG TPA: phosphate starvation-inducible protein PhoH [Spirochaetia bacterium]|nr:phosphate starvation-inducible protein PhoH [Spirochaetia bacterium]
MIKNFVLDTNVLMHNPNALYSFHDNNVIIPITVIEELDKFKSSLDKKGMHARQVLREIDACIKKGALKKGAKIKSGGTLMIFLHDPETNLADLDRTINDNKILASALAIQKKSELITFFISKDVNARIKAEALGIKARDYEKEIVEYSNLYRGWKEITVSAEEIAALYAGGSAEAKGIVFFENEYAMLKDKNNPKSSAICRYDSLSRALSLMRDEQDAMGIKPLNLEQRFAFDLLLNDKVKLVTLVGQAGSGKTLIALACGLTATIGKSPKYEKMLVARPIIPMGKDIGYLPGSKDQKLNYWMQPIFDNLGFILKNNAAGGQGNNELHELNDKTDYLLKSGILEIEALTYIRGRSIPGQFMIVDEAQNLTPHEIKTIISRAGEGTKIVLTGDPDQIDNPYLDANSNGLTYTVERLKNQKIAGHILLSKSERSELASLAVEYL